MSVSSSLRAAVSSTAFGTGLAAGMVFMGGSPADAQTPATPADSTGVALPQISVQGQPDNTLQGTTGMGRLPGSLQSLPQTIQVVPQEVMQQQGVTSLEQALRNVPGITSSIGEGNGGVNGDQLRIRGFNAQNDLFVDGLRDFGAYRRDSFTFEEVQALLGPAGVTFGSGSAGGSVNVVSRTPRLGNFLNADVMAGMRGSVRATADANYQISDTMAFRLNIMGQTARIPGRDTDRGERWGIAPSIAFGLGTNTTLTVEYLHYDYDEATDAGVPVLARPGGMGRPVTEDGVSRERWYGTPTDRDQVTVDRVTARLQHQATDWLTLYNDTRAGVTDRFFSFSIANCDGTCQSRFFNGGGTPMYGFSGGGSPFETTTWGVQNITTAVGRFNTGPLRHEATLGFDIWYEDFERVGYSYGADRTAFRGNLFYPENNTPFSFTRSTAANATRRSETTSMGVFASDRIWFTPEISILGGVRWNRQETDYQAFGPGTPITEYNASNSFVDPRAAIIWEPTPNYTFYFSYAQSTFAPGSNWATQPGQASANNAALDPEENTIYELGGRASILGGQLGLSAAIYQIEKNNATETNPATGTVISTGDRQRIQGLDLGVTGRITPAWLINARYSYMNSETTRSLTPANEGNQVALVPEHAASLWTSYEFNQGQPWNFTLGGGFTWNSSIYLNAGNTSEVPESFSLDAFVSHKINEQVTFRLNGYNLTDHRNYTQLFGNRAVMGPGRAVTFTVATAF